MSGFSDEALPEGWDALCIADTLALSPPTGAKDRVRLHVAATLGLAAGLGAAGAVATAASSPAPAQGLLGALLKFLFVKKVVVLAVVAATAVTGGTAAYVQVRARKQEAAERALSSKAPAARPPGLAVEAAAAPVAAVAPVPKDSLGEERALLDGARLAISQGRLEEAQGLLERHATSFPEGRLGEEREALNIRLLLRQGNAREAARLAARFRRVHPHSIQQPGIDEALRTGRR
jgi:hypothetical protein